MRIAVTGSHGFIGAACVRRLEADGHAVVPIDRRNGIDVLDQAAIHRALDGVDAVIHLAALLGTAELYDTADAAVDVNVKGTLRVLDACRAHGVAYVGITQPDVWANVYSATRHCAARLALAYHRDFGVPVTHVTAFNAYGPGQAHGPGHPQKIIPTFASCLWEGRPVPVWGDGTQTVDLVHVDHIADCLVRAATEPDQQLGHGETWHAGSGVELSVLEVARLVHEVTGGPFLVEFLPMRPGETPNTRLCATTPGPFGYDPIPLAEGLAETVASYRPAAVAAA